MTPEQPHHPAGSLPTALALAAVAGFVDAHVYLRVTPVFVANMSGNLVHFGMFAGSADWREALGSLVALAAFVAGVVLATVLHDREVRAARPVRPDRLLALEAVLVLAMPLALTVGHVRFHAQTTPSHYPVLLLGGVAMGLQTAALRRVGAVAVATTYGTGALVRIGEKATLAARRADRATSHRRRVAVAVLCSVLSSYVAGAVLAAALGGDRAPLLLPGAVLVVVAAVAARQVDRGRGSAGTVPEAVVTR